MIRKFVLTATAAGADGSATGSVTSDRPITGQLLAVHLNFDAGQAATTDTTITAAAPTRTLLTITDSATDALYQPRNVVHDEAGAIITYDGTREVHAPVPLNDYLTVTLAQANNGKGVAATFWVLEV